MLSTTAQHRLYAHVPGNEHRRDVGAEPLDITYYTPRGRARQTQVWLDVGWAEENHTFEYPAVVLELSPTSVQRYDGRKIADTIRKYARPSDPTIAYERVEGTRLYDVLNITVAVREGQDGIPKGALAKEIAQAIFATFRFEVDYLNEPGTTREGDPLFGEDAHVDALDWAQPMVVEPMSGEGMVNTSAMVDEQHVTRYEMQFRVEYELTHSVLVEAVEAIEYDVTVNGSPVTQERVSVAHPTIGSGEPQTAWRGN